MARRVNLSRDRERTRCLHLIQTAFDELRKRADHDLPGIPPNMLRREDIYAVEGWLKSVVIDGFDPREKKEGR